MCSINQCWSVCVCLGMCVVAPRLPDTWLCLVLAPRLAHQMFSFFIILHLHRVLWGLGNLCRPHSTCCVVCVVFFCLFFLPFSRDKQALGGFVLLPFFNFLVFFPTWKHFLKINVLGLLVIAVHILWKEIILNYHIWVFSLIFVNILKCLSHLMCRLLRTDTFIVETVTLLLFK